MVEKMKISEIPVIILAAGKGTRLGSKFDGKNKLLLPFNEDYTLLDLLLYSLISFDVKSIIIIGGYRFGILKNYIRDLKQNFKGKKIFADISDKFAQCDINVIRARDDYEKGPLYTLLTINKFIFEKKFNSIIRDEKLSSNHFTSNHLRQSKYFTIIPSDTVFSKELLQNILNMDFNGPDYEKKNVNEKIPTCYLFGLRFSKEKLLELNKSKAYSGSYLLFSQEIFKEIKNFNNFQPRDDQDCFIQIPLVIISKEFLKFTETLLDSGIKKLASAINKFREIGNISTHIIPFKESSFFFEDIDTIENFKNVIEKNEDFGIPKK